MKDKNASSLGSPIGVVAANISYKTEGDVNEILPLRYAICLKAFARLHLNDEITWDTLIVDDIMKEGLDLYTISQKGKPNLHSPSDIYMQNEEAIKREFQLSSFTFHVELKPPLKNNDSNSFAVGAKDDGVEFTLEDFIPATKSFFRQHKYGLLKVNSFYSIIWRTQDAYFVLDVCGRRVNDFKADNITGVAMLMCFKSLQNVRHLIANLSDLQSSDPLIIRELKVVKIITPDGDKMQQVYGKRSRQYEIVNDDYAYLASELHLSLNKRDTLRNRSSLPVAIAAIVASKIDHPATWDIKVIDKLICFGVNFCQSYWLKCKVIDDIDANEFPTYFTMGQFDVNIELEVRKYKGTWRCVPGYKKSELADNIKKAFDAEHNKLILQLNQQVYAIWRKHEFIYLLDPYRHRILGKQTESEIYDEMAKSATLRMFRSFDVFLNVLNHILLDSNRTSPFFVHSVKVKNIQAQQNEKLVNVRPIEEPNIDAYGEILSLNEYICFEEVEENCQSVLEEISDYEDEDLKSDVDEIELKTSSSEEEPVEEEEAQAQIEDMEGIESSSSGEEGGADNSNVDGRKGRGFGRKGKGKGTKKGRTKNKSKGKQKYDNKDDVEDRDTKKKRKEQIPKDDKTDKTSSGKQDQSRKNKSSGERTEIEQDLEATNKTNKNLIKSNKFDGFTKTDGQNDVRDTRSRKRSRDRDQTKDKQNSDKDRSRHRDISKTEDSSKNKGNSKNKNKNLMQDNDKVSMNSGISNTGENTGSNRNIRKDLSRLRYRNKSEDLNKGGAKDSNKENNMDDNKSMPKDNTRDKYQDFNKSKPDKISEETAQKGHFRRDRTQFYTDGTEADDENEEYCCKPNPNSYPGYYKHPVDMPIIGTESGSYESICILFRAAFKVADRLLLMTPWDNFVIFRCIGIKERHYFLFDGCVCNLDRLRHLNLHIGTAGLIAFEHIHNVIEYIRQLRKTNRSYCNQLDSTVDNICKEYFSKNLRL